MEIIDAWAQQPTDRFMAQPWLDTPLRWTGQFVEPLVCSSGGHEPSPPLRASANIRRLIADANHCSGFRAKRDEYARGPTEHTLTGWSGLEKQSIRSTRPVDKG